MEHPPEPTKAVCALKKKITYTIADKRQTKAEQVLGENTREQGAPAQSLPEDTPEQGREAPPPAAPEGPRGVSRKALALKGADRPGKPSSRKADPETDDIDLAGNLLPKEKGAGQQGHPREKRGQRLRPCASSSGARLGPGDWGTRYTCHDDLVQPDK